MEKRVKNIKNVIVLFVVCFLSVITYLTWFNLFQSDKIKNDVSNPRMVEEEKNIIRGSILDRYGEKIAYTDKDKNRVYSYGEIFGNITGYSSKIYGKSFIEGYYNTVLLGKEFSLGSIEVFLNRIKYNVLNKEKVGDNLVLTVDAKLQKRIYSKFGQDKGAAVCINPKTGEILAMVSKPSIDPNDIDKNFERYSKETSKKYFINKAIQEYYPPGSIFKIITAAAAIENINDIDRYKNNCTGSIDFKNHSIKDYKGEKHGNISLKDAFKVSCNNTFGKLGLQLGYNKIKKVAEKFLFNKDVYIKDDYVKIPIKPAVYDFDERDDSFIAASAIGQHEVKANPMSMAIVVSAIANNGTIMEPYIVDSITDSQGNVKYKRVPKALTEAVDKETADKIKEYMLSTVKEGTARRANTSSIQIAAKTGTAENEEGKEPHSWFVAFAPYQNPQIAVAVVVENGGAGSGKALDIAKDAIVYYLNNK